MPDVKTIQAFLERDDLKARFEELLDKRASSFLTSVISLVNSNWKLAECDPMTIYSAAMSAATLKLPVDSNLWFAYIVPYKNGKTNKYEAQFQLGYKWYIQLAQRSNQIKTISATPVYEWQLVSEDPLLWFEFDRKAKTSDNIVGYASYLKLINWFEKVMYMTVEEINQHWSKFSSSYKLDKSKGWKNSLRSKDFDSMAEKTVIKLLLSKYAPLSVDLENAIRLDQWVIRDYDLQEVDYVDNNQEELTDIDLDEKLKEVTTLSDNEKNND